MCFIKRQTLITSSLKIVLPFIVLCRGHVKDEGGGGGLDVRVIHHYYNKEEKPSSPACMSTTSKRCVSTSVAGMRHFRGRIQSFFWVEGKRTEQGHQNRTKSKCDWQPPHTAFPNPPTASHPFCPDKNHPAMQMKGCNLQSQHQ